MFLAGVGEVDLTRALRIDKGFCSVICLVP